MKNKLREILNRSIVLKQDAMNDIIENIMSHGTIEDLEELNKLLDRIFKIRY